MIPLRSGNCSDAIAFGVVICNMALMDIEDLNRTYSTVSSVVSQKFLTKESLQKRSGGCHFDREPASEDRTNCLIVRDIEILRSAQDDRPLPKKLLKESLGHDTRVLRPKGRFIFSVLHPCFETPFSVGDGEPMQVDDEGDFHFLRILNYSEEGRWYSGGTGMRGTFGSIHRKVSTYLNGLIENGFGICRIEEPILPGMDYDSARKQLASKIAKTMVVDAVYI